MRVFVLVVVAALALPLAGQQAQPPEQAQQAQLQPPAPAQPAAPASQTQQQLQIPEASAFIQSAPVSASSPAFPRPAYFRHHFLTPSTRVELKPPARLQDFVHSGKLEMSLRDYLELVLANNTDIALQRLTVEVPKNNIERAFSIFDPAFVGSFTATREKQAATNATQGGNILNNLNQRANFSYVQTFGTGTQFTMGFNGTKSSSNNAFATYIPSIGTSMSFGMAQPLLRNRGSFITRLPISVARSTLKRSEFDLRDQMLRILSDAENAYWDVIDSRENLRVQEEYFKLQGEFLKRSERELQLGAISQLDIYRPQQSYASAEIQVSRYKFLLAQREDALRRYVGADLDPQVRTLPLNLTETVMPPSSEQVIDSEGAVQRAVAMRPDLKALMQSLDIDELNIKSAANGLRPDLSLTLGYAANGRGGNYYERENVFGGGSVVSRIIPGGLGTAMDQLFGFDVPRYEFGLTLRLPIRDRRASADMANALVAKKQDTLRLRSLEQNIRLNVLNAANQIESAKAGVDLAKKAVQFAQLQVDAEQKKYDLGVSIAQFVLQTQADLVNAQSELVRQTVAYQRARVNLLRMTGELLEERGIILQ